MPLGFDQIRDQKDIKKSVRLLKADQDRVRGKYERLKAIIAQAQAILARLDDRYLVRLDNYFRKEF